ncbi:MAG: T9SS type A sorting domain-containing protein [Bacteroidota bacterium]
MKQDLNFNDNLELEPYRTARKKPTCQDVYPFDNSGSYSTTSYGVNRVDAFDILYPTKAQPPIMYLNYDRTYDSYNDMWVNCAAYHTERRANSDKLKDNPSLSFSAEMYPSPSDGKYTFKCQLPNGKGTLFITDLSTRIIFTQNFYSYINSTKLDLSYLNNGLYFWKVFDDNGNTKTGRVTLLK